MRFGRDLWFAFAVLLLGCQGSASRESRPPESLGAVPEDLPLPPRFTLDGEAGESSIGARSGMRTCTLFLKGPFPAGEVREFFRDHLRLARWKPVEPAPVPGSLVFRKGKERVEVEITGGGSSCRVRVVLNPLEEREIVDER
jgi:hypothetical protein